MIAAPKPQISQSPDQMFVLTLVAKPGQDGIRALRGFLKLALRRFGLRCIDVREQK